MWLRSEMEESRMKIDEIIDYMIITIRRGRLRNEA